MPPWIAWFVTVTGTVALVAIALLGIAAMSLLAETNVVAMAALLKFTTALVAKLVPSTSNENGPVVAMTLGGFSWVMVGVDAGVAGLELWDP